MEWNMDKMLKLFEKDDVDPLDVLIVLGIISFFILCSVGGLLALFG